MREFPIGSTKWQLSAEGFEEENGEGSLQLQVCGLRFYLVCNGKRFPPIPHAGWEMARAYLEWNGREGFFQYMDGGIIVALNSQGFSQLQSRFAGKYVGEKEKSGSKFEISGISPIKRPPSMTTLMPFAPASPEGPPPIHPRTAPLQAAAAPGRVMAPAPAPAPAAAAAAPSNMSLPLKRVFVGVRLFTAIPGADELVLNSALDRLEMTFHDSFSSKQHTLQEHIPRASIESVYVGHGPSGAFLALLLRSTAQLSMTRVGGIVFDPTRSMSSTDYTERPNRFIVVDLLHACDGDVLQQILAHWMGTRAGDVVHLAENPRSAELNSQVALILTLDRRLGSDRDDKYREVSERAKLEIAGPPDAEVHAAAERLLLGNPPRNNPPSSSTFSSTIADWNSGARGGGWGFSKSSAFLSKKRERSDSMDSIDY